MRKKHRMTMARQHEFQPILESSTKNAPSPAASDVFVVYETPIDTPVVHQESTEEYLSESAESKKATLNSWLSFKVKNELVSQVYTNAGHDDTHINIAAVQDVISAELKSEKDKILQSALYLHNAIPPAAARPKPDMDKPTTYWAKDVPNLQKRIDVHFELTNYIKGIEATGDEGLYDLAETYIQKTLVEAQDEVLAILVQQKEELESRNVQNEAKITALQGIIGTLESELEYAHEQLEDRDMSILDQELMAHLENEAKKFAQ